MFFSGLFRFVKNLIAMLFLAAIIIIAIAFIDKCAKNYEKQRSTLIYEK
jgi:hypothetical protein